MSKVSEDEEARSPGGGHMTVAFRVVLHAVVSQESGWGGGNDLEFMAHTCGEGYGWGKNGHGGGEIAQVGGNG